jgi:hypothetical protein
MTSKKKPVAKQKPRAKKDTYSIPDCCPFRPDSSYATVFSVLYAHREKGMTRDNLLSELQRISTKKEALLKFDISVVTSPSHDGTAHRSANKAANSYYVEKGEGGNLKLVMRK